MQCLRGGAWEVEHVRWRRMGAYSGVNHLGLGGARHTVEHHILIVRAWTPTFFETTGLAFGMPQWSHSVPQSKIKGNVHPCTNLFLQTIDVDHYRLCHGSDRYTQIIFHAYSGNQYINDVMWGNQFHLASIILNYKKTCPSYLAPLGLILLRKQGTSCAKHVEVHDIVTIKDNTCQVELIAPRGRIFCVFLSDLWRDL